MLPPTCVINESNSPRHPHSTPVEKSTTTVSLDGLGQTASFEQTVVAKEFNSVWETFFDSVTNFIKRKKYSPVHSDVTSIESIEFFNQPKA
mmetsp:Transcript_107986/g.220475  ORF Transcript_107986/g.220475 Transcript_107986/m.220475 type:complete len:91 (+) Transcript_107986:3157-3429(+)